MSNDAGLTTMFIVIFIAAFTTIPQGIPMVAASKNHQDTAYLEFVTDATELPQEQHYDYIVVGGGTAGCPLAATLSEKFSVLLLERGGTPHENPDTLRAEKFFNNLLQANDKDSPAQKFISEDGVSNIRPRVLGGGTAINAGFYSRGHPEFYKESGIDFDMDRVEKSYQWVEQRIVNPIDIENQEWQKSVKEGLLEAGANSPYHGFRLDHVQGTKISGSTFDRDGQRHPAMELLSSGNRDNLKVAVHASVEKIIFSPLDSPAGLCATGVIYKDTKGVLHKANLKDSNGEVILSAGSIGSTQLLLLSGVGPEQYLSSLNISTVKDNPYVGKHMVDPPRSNINIIPPFPVETNRISVVGITPDYFIEAMASTFEFDSPINPILFPYPSPPVKLPVLNIFQKLATTTSVGTLDLVSSTDAEVEPKVRFNYYSTPDDLARCVGGIRNMKQVMSSKAMEKYKFEGGKNGGKSFRFVGSVWDEHASLEAMCRDAKTTIWHYHGGCVVGKVVDQDLKVIGVNALRVVDGSTFTLSPGTNPQATLMMFGRHVGLKIQEERRLPTWSEL